MESLKVTRAQEEIQTLKKFIENQGIEFVPKSAIQDRLLLKEPCDVSYQEIEYQITYSNRKLLGDLRKTTSVRSKENPNVSEIFCGIISHPPLVDYAKEILEAPLRDKKDKSDGKMILLIEPAYTSYGLSPEGESAFKEYFNNNKQRLGGSWQHIFIVFSGKNIQLR